MAPEEGGGGGAGEEFFVEGANFCFLTATTEAGVDEEAESFEQVDASEGALGRFVVGLTEEEDEMTGAGGGEVGE